jgi:hypothetical protein
MKTELSKGLSIQPDHNISYLAFAVYYILIASTPYPLSCPGNGGGSSSCEIVVKERKKKKASGF